MADIIHVLVYKRQTSCHMNSHRKTRGRMLTYSFPLDIGKNLRNHISNVLELRLFCLKPSICDTNYDRTTDATSPKIGSYGAIKGVKMFKSCHSESLILVITILFFQSSLSDLVVRNLNSAFVTAFCARILTLDTFINASCVQMLW